MLLAYFVFQGIRKLHWTFTLLCSIGNSNQSAVKTLENKLEAEKKPETKTRTLDLITNYKPTWSVYCLVFEQKYISIATRKVHTFGGLFDIDPIGWCSKYSFPVE